MNDYFLIQNNIYDANEYLKLKVEKFHGSENTYRKKLGIFIN